MKADVQALGQVVRNLIVNAIKYSPAGTLIEVTASCQEEQVILLRHAVKDCTTDSRVAISGQNVLYPAPQPQSIDCALPVMPLAASVQR